jgi:hypothetical protein
LSVTNAFDLLLPSSFQRVPRSLTLIVISGLHVPVPQLFQRQLPMVQGGPERCVKAA